MGMALNPIESPMAEYTGNAVATGAKSNSGAGTETGETENVDLQGGDVGGRFDFDG